MFAGDAWRFHDETFDSRRNELSVLNFEHASPLRYRLLSEGLLPGGSDLGHAEKVWRSRRKLSDNSRGPS